MLHLARVQLPEIPGLSPAIDVSCPLPPDFLALLRASSLAPSLDADPDLAATLAREAGIHDLGALEAAPAAGDLGSLPPRSWAA
mmetsp:Transcript_5085/g.15382  ORF Transcript_5085/g.15382 Transcript_5085/m.15382 type:complete len:84 (+) Transcript_5085:851-1102(+)